MRIQRSKKGNFCRKSHLAHKIGEKWNISERFPRGDNRMLTSFFAAKNCEVEIVDRIPRRRMESPNVSEASSVHSTLRRKNVMEIFSKIRHLFQIDGNRPSLRIAHGDYHSYISRLSCPISRNSNHWQITAIPDSVLAGSDVVRVAAR